MSGFTDSRSEPKIKEIFAALIPLFSRGKRSRKNRFAPLGYWLHLTQRGNDRQRIFMSDADRQHFLTLLESRSEERHVRIAAYAIMSAIDGIAGHPEYSPNHLRRNRKPPPKMWRTLTPPHFSVKIIENFSLRNPLIIGGPNCPAKTDSPRPDSGCTSPNAATTSNASSSATPIASTSSNSSNSAARSATSAFRPTP